MGIKHLDDDVIRTSPWFGESVGIETRILTSAQQKKGMYVTRREMRRLNDVVEGKVEGLRRAIRDRGNQKQALLNAETIQELFENKYVREMAGLWWRLTERWGEVEFKVSNASARLVGLDVIIIDLEMAAWTFASTMAHIPHFYTLREKWNGSTSFGTLVEVLQLHGTLAGWGGVCRKYIHANGWKYWAMSYQSPSAGVVNRAVEDHLVDYPSVPWPRVLTGTVRKLPEGRVLDVGCAGKGKLISLAGIPPARYTGVAPAPTCEEASEAHKFHASRILRTEARHLWPPWRYDAVVVTDPSWLIDEDWKRIWSLVRPGGQLVVPRPYDAPGLGVVLPALAGQDGTVGILERSRTKPLHPPMMWDEAPDELGKILPD